MKRILIIEDKKSEADSISAVIKKVDSTAKVFHEDNIADAYKCAFENKISIFIVDIVLQPGKKNDASGLDFVEKIRKYPDYKYTPIIFITSLEDRRLYAYDKLHCYKYIQKPIFNADVEKTIREVLDFDTPVADDATLKIRNEGVIYAIPQKDIIYAKSRMSKMSIYTNKDCIDTYYTSCNDLMKQLDPDIFIQCGRGMLVNKNKVNAYEIKEGALILEGIEDKIKVGRVYKNTIMKEFAKND